MYSKHRYMYMSEHGHETYCTIYFRKRPKNSKNVYKIKHLPFYCKIIKIVKSPGRKT